MNNNKKWCWIKEWNKCRLLLLQLFSNSVPFRTFRAHLLFKGPVYARVLSGNVSGFFNVYWGKNINNNKSTFKWILCSSVPGRAARWDRVNWYLTHTVICAVWGCCKIRWVFGENVHRGGRQVHFIQNHMSTKQLHGTVQYTVGGNAAHGHRARIIELNVR